MQEKLKQHLTTAQDVQAKYHDSQHLRVQFMEGEQVWLHTTNLKTDHPSKKLDHHKIGPFWISKVINN